MFHALPELNRRSIASVVGLVVLFAFAPGVRAGDEKSIRNFRDAIIKLSPDVDPVEAEQISYTAHTTARRLAKEYRVVGLSIFQNFLIHTGSRSRGFCFHWARDIGAELKKLKPKTLVLHWGAADPGKSLEHNVIVVTARNQPFRDGYLIDGWRMAGRLMWWPVKKDNTYRWGEDMRETAWLQDYEPKQAAPAARTAKRTSAASLQANATDSSAGPKPQPNAAAPAADREPPQDQLR